MFVVREACRRQSELTIGFAHNNRVSVFHSFSSYEPHNFLGVADLPFLYDSINHCEPDRLDERISQTDSVIVHEGQTFNSL